MKLNRSRINRIYSIVATIIWEIFVIIDIALSPKLSLGTIVLACVGAAMLIGLIATIAKRNK